jgi:flagellar biosynthesis GTPase FlhF
MEISYNALWGSAKKKKKSAHRSSNKKSGPGPCIYDAAYTPSCAYDGGLYYVDQPPNGHSSLAPCSYYLTDMSYNSDVQEMKSLALKKPEKEPSKPKKSPKQKTAALEMQEKVRKLEAALKKEQTEHEAKVILLERKNREALRREKELLDEKALQQAKQKAKEEEEKKGGSPKMVNVNQLKDQATQVDNEQCVICATNKKVVVCMPCSHISTCISCCTQKDTPIKTCPLCRGTIDQFLVVS